MSKREDLAGNLKTIRARLSELGPGAGTQPRVVQAFDHLTALADARAFPRGGSGGGGGKGSHSDPTAHSATDEQRQAEAAKLIADRDRICKSLETAAKALDETEEMVDLLFNPNTPSKASPGCVVCDLVRGDDGRPHPMSWQAVKARERCGWHYRFRFGDGPDRPGFGTDPVLALNRWHLDHLGEELRPSLIRDHMPVEFGAREARKRRPGTCHYPTGKDGAPCVREFMHDGICSPVLAAVA